MHGPLALAHNGNLVNAPALRDELLTRGLRAHRDQRHRGDDADARRRRWADLGGPRRAHAAGVEGCLLVGHPGRRPGDRRTRPMGFPADERRSPSPWWLRRGLRDLRTQHARLPRHQRSRARRDRHAQRRRDDPPPGAHSRRSFGSVHVRVRLLQPARQRLGGSQHAPRTPAPRRGARRRSTRRRPTW